MVRSTRIVDETESVEDRYFITSLTDVQQFSEAARKHWGIENNLHWCLDVNFDEDNCRMRKDNSGENLAVIRHIALNLYKSFTKVKLSMKAKRFRCSFDDQLILSFCLSDFQNIFLPLSLLTSSFFFLVNYNIFFRFFHAVALNQHRKFHSERRNFNEKA